MEEGCVSGGVCTLANAHNGIVTHRRAMDVNTRRHPAVSRVIVLTSCTLLAAAALVALCKTSASGSAGSQPVLGAVGLTAQVDPVASDRITWHKVQKMVLNHEAESSWPRTRCPGLDKYRDFLSDSVLWDAPFELYGCAKDDCECAVKTVETRPKVCFPSKVPVWARRQESYQSLALARPTYYSCQWRQELGKELSSPMAADALPMAEAKTKCMANTECIGITRKADENGNLWTLRSGSELTAPMSGDTPLYTSEELESLVLQRGLCTCACSGGPEMTPPVCIWQAQYNKMLKGAVKRKDTCVSAGTAMNVQGPRCDGPQNSGMDAASLEAWLNDGDDTLYTIDAAKALCQKVNRQSTALPGKPRACSGIDLDAASGGWVLKSGDVIDQPGGSVFNCEDATKTDPPWECEDVKLEQRVGCFWEKVEGSTWLSSDGMLASSNGVPAQTCYTLDDAKKVCDVTAGCGGVNLELADKNRCNCGGDVKWNLAAGSTPMPAKPDAQADSVYICHARIGLPQSSISAPAPLTSNPYQCPGLEGGREGDEADGNSGSASDEESGVRAPVNKGAADEAAVQDRQGGQGAAKGGIQEHGSEANAGASSGGSGSAVSPSSAASSASPASPAPSPPPPPPPSPPPPPPAPPPRGFGDPRTCEDGALPTCEWLPNVNKELGGGVPRKYTCSDDVTQAVGSEAPSCEGPRNRLVTTDFLESWLNDYDETAYEQVEEAKAMCEKADRKHPRACSGVSKEGTIGWKLKSGGILKAEKTGGVVMQWSCQCSSAQASAVHTDLLRSPMPWSNLG